MSESVKLVLVGDGTVGKTCLLTVYRSGEFPAEYVPTVVDNFTRDVSVDDKQCKLHLWDTAGQEDYDRLRPMSYSGASVFLLCFSVDSRNTYMNIKTKWHPELCHYANGVPIVLVGTKIDLRTNQDTIQHLSRQGTTAVSTEEGKAMANSIGASVYLECSAIEGEGLDDVFQEAVRVHIAAQSRGKKKERKFRASKCDLL